jgi:hypothetical protein
MFYNLYIKNHGLNNAGYHNGLEAFIITDDKLTFRKQEQLLNDGFKLIWDSARRYEEAEKYANEEYDAHTHCCCLCDRYISTSLIKGRRWNNNHEKYLVFNGYVCPQCEDGLEVTGKVIKTDSFPDSDKIHFPERFTNLAISDFPELKEK